MVHRPADSRLLSNLLSHERDYSKHLAHLLEHSRVSLASFSAYAAASPPPLSQVILSVAGVLAGADDALRKYSASVQDWQAQLEALRDLEDEVGNIMRDREILVTRLIKASNKSHKSNRDSSTGSTPSPSSSSLTVRLEVPVGAKLGAAQTELQACEVHLAMKERGLEEMRIRAITTGLQARCKAMVECGWVWGEMGKEGLRALEGGETATTDGNVFGTPPYSRPSSNSDLGHAPSDLSSIAPSQSASQLSPDAPHHVPQPPAKPLPHVQAYRPPAHAIDERNMSDGRPNGAPRASWRISEVPEPDEEEECGGSSADEDESNLEVRENERFASRRRATAEGKEKEKAGEVEHTPFSIRPVVVSETLGKHAKTPPVPPSPSTDAGSFMGRKERNRGGTTSLFGRTIGALFHRDGKEKERSSSISPRKTSVGKAGGGWRTRTDTNLAIAHRGKGDESSDDEQTRQLYSTWSPRTAAPQKPASVALGPSASMSSVNTTGSKSAGGQKLKKLKRSSVQVPPRTRAASEASEKGWASDTTGKKGIVWRAGAAGNQKASDKPTPKGKAKTATTGEAASPSATKHPLVAAVATSEASMSRSSSLSRQSFTTAASTSARPPSRSVTAPLVPSQASATMARTRALSLQPADPPAASTASTSTSQTSSSVPTQGHVKGHRRTASTSSAMSHRSGLTRDNDGPSLMSIVEGVARPNKEASTAQDPNRKLVEVKAPPSISVSEEVEDALIATDASASGQSHDADVSSNGGHANGAVNGGSSDSGTSTEGRSAKQSRKPASNAQARQPSPQSNHTEMSASASAPSLPASSSLSAVKPKLPLRSALRNSSRTPSPNPPPVRPAPSLDAAVEQSGPAGSTSPRNSLAVPCKSAIPAKDDDTASMSSYETGHEEFDEASTPTAKRSPEPPLPPLPPSDDALPSGDLSGGPTAREGSAAVRRKSVRMSLPPTFSTTPPALDENDEDSRERHAPWAPSGKWTSRMQDSRDRDAWQDSSDEDEEYSKARRLLSRMSRGRT